ncbi:MAG TPA: universal stress protein [Peptococcaceae bacterium]|jgi:two-component system sensor histidine kinase KdpD|nr:universal stress protein [Peptococcaceae bacterium]HPZ70779.1 universal stress protein [Peptococcaceae bacterium]HQD54049.1 universal stress protein [Peptococcaceae bacterium]
MPGMNKCTDERILVCVYYGPNGERLIKRGIKIAQMSNCPLYILHIDPKPLDEMDAEKSDYIAKWRRLAEENGAEEFVLLDNEPRPAYQVIAEVARQKRITQIIIGESPHSRWEQISKESIVNALLREIPFIDLHIVSVARYMKDADDNYNKGVRAYLVKEDDHYRLTFIYTHNVEYEGIFFKESGTDFNNGIFRFRKEQETIQVQVIEDLVKDFTNVELETN